MRTRTSGPACHVAIVGAGPYGLAAAAHLRAAGVDVHVFGRLMSFWRHRMPDGMLLLTPPRASSLASPEEALTLRQYEAVERTRLPDPIPLDDFLHYAAWFQRLAVPEIDERRVLRIERNNEGFELSLDDDERVAADRVVVAAGPADFAWRPKPFSIVPRPFVFHSSELRDLSELNDRRRPVVVIGTGQSALESAALLREAGADVELIARAPRIRWLSAVHHPEEDGALGGLLHPEADLGPPVVNQVVAHPAQFHRLPHWLRARITASVLAPAGAPWLRSRLQDVPLTTGRNVTSVERARSRVLLKLNDGTERRVHRVLLATGYRVEIARHGFLPHTLVAAIRTRHGAPELRRGFESSVPGLHFLGLPAVESFGPIMGFVAGAKFAAETLTAHVVASGESAVVRDEPQLVA